jgi:PIN domain nuclease of toxin-antitoxin system
LSVVSRCVSVKVGHIKIAVNAPDIVTVVVSIWELWIRIERFKIRIKGLSKAFGEAQQTNHNETYPFDHDFELIKPHSNLY